MLRLFLSVSLCSGVITEDYKDFFLNKHNEYRRISNAANMKKMTWNSTLEAKAASWLTNCQFTFENSAYGENLAVSGKTDPSKAISDAMEMWYSEKSDYKYGLYCGFNCHYTQMIWADTNEVGCAIKKCEKIHLYGTTLNRYLVGCYYNPRGNIFPRYPYMEGAPCSACDGSTCENGLCV